MITRTRLALLFAVGAFVSVGAACSLNPQPLPPDTVDASKTGGDADASTAFGDSGEPAPDSGFDYDASTDSPTGIIDAAPDAEVDASDATVGDASSDAREED